MPNLKTRREKEENIKISDWVTYRDKDETKLDSEESSEEENDSQDRSSQLHSSIPQPEIFLLIDFDEKDPAEDAMVDDLSKRLAAL
jgi:hypothetical protein